MEGEFYFEPGARNEDFLYISKKLLKDFITASELKILGLQRQGFYALLMAFTMTIVFTKSINMVL
jgi:hypothetical protein